MSAQFHKRDGDGALFKNKAKETDRQPDYRGSILIGAQEYWLSAWLKTSREGEKFLSLSARAKLLQDVRAALPHKQAAPENELDDEIPF